MLVLTRKLMERLYIGEDICVTVVRLEGGQVRLGIEAPRSIPVVRAELAPGHPAEFATTAAQLPTPAPAAPRPPAARGPSAVRLRPAAIPGIDSRRRGPSR